MGETSKLNLISGPWRALGVARLPDHLKPRAERCATALERVEALREHFQAELIRLLDEAEGDADLEPSLAHPEAPLTLFRPARYGLHSQPTLGATDDREDDVEREPMFGGVGDAMNQTRWAQHGSDSEEEHDGREPGEDDEPSLGSLDGAQHTVVTKRSPEGRALAIRLTDPIDQRSWGSSGVNDVEEQCEDEGGACEDEGSQSDDEGDAQAGVQHVFNDNGRKVWPPLEVR